jgi:ribonuclease D
LENSRNVSGRTKTVHEPVEIDSDYIIVDNFEALNLAKQCLQGKSMLSVDCQRIGLSKTVHLCLVLISDGSKEFLFDSLVDNVDFVKEMSAFLKQILEDEQITKIIHSCKEKSNALYLQFGILLHNIIDAQVLYRYIDTGTSEKLISLQSLFLQY